MSAVLVRSRQAALRTLGLRARIGLLTGGFAVALTLLIVAVAVRITRNQVRSDAGAMLAAEAAQTAETLDRGVYERFREIQVAAGIDPIRDPAVAAESKRALLERMRGTYPDYAWIGLTDTNGHVLVSTGGLLEGADVSTRPWCVEGRAAPFVGDVHEAILLAALLPNPTREPLRFLDFAAPVYAPDGRFAGVLGAHLGWGWAGEVQQSVPRASHSNDGSVFLVGRDGTVLLGPGTFASRFPRLLLPSLRGAGVTPDWVQETWPDGKAAITGYARADGYRDFQGLGWTVLVRQGEQEAFAPAARLQHHIVIAGIGLGAIFAWFGWTMAGTMVAPVLGIAAAADRVREGERGTPIPGVERTDEIGTLGGSLAALVAGLTDKENQLTALNAELEQRVEERTSALQQSEERFARVVATMQAGLIVFEAHGGILLANPVAERISRLMSTGDPARPYELSAVTYLTVEGAPLPFEQLTSVRAIRAGEAVTDERFILRHRDGEEFVLSSSSAPLRDTAGTVIGAVTTYVDVTERTRARQELEESRRFNDQIITASPDVIYIHDLVHNRTVYTNRELVALLGYPADDVEAMGQETIPYLTHPDDLPRLADRLCRLEVAVDGEIVEDEFRVRHHDGTWRWLYSRDVILTRDENGTPRRILGVARDITERKDAEDALRRSEERFRGIYENAVEGMFQTHFGGDPTWSANPAMARIFGFETAGRLVAALPSIRELIADPLVRVTFLGALNDVGEVREQEVRILRRDGSDGWVLLSARRLHNTDGGPAGVEGTVVDITERRRAAAAIARQAALLDLAHDAIITRTLDGDIQFWNRGAARLYGWTAAEAVVEAPRSMLAIRQTRWPDRQPDVARRAEGRS